MEDGASPRAGTAAMSGGPRGWASQEIGNAEFGLRNRGVERERSGGIAGEYGNFRFGKSATRLPLSNFN
jgi:hypothetical protein